MKLKERLAESLRAATANLKRGAGEDLVITATVLNATLGNPGANVPAAALLGLGVDMGGVIVELEARGAVSGERIAAARSSRRENRGSSRRTSPRSVMP